MLFKTPIVFQVNDMVTIHRRMLAAAICVWLLSLKTFLLAAPQDRVIVKPEPKSDVWGEVRVTTDRVPAAQFTIAPNGAAITFFGYHKGYKIYDVTSGKVAWFNCGRDCWRRSCSNGCSVRSGAAR